MDKVFIVLGSRYGYSKTLFGIYNDRLLAENRVSELTHIDVVEIEEISLNTEIEVDF
jgi:hypothetical protein